MNLAARKPCSNEMFSTPGFMHTPCAGAKNPRIGSTLVVQRRILVHRF
jgi:hypothetical protein